MQYTFFNAISQIYTIAITSKF